jgi:hypothetical protein
LSGSRPKKNAPHVAHFSVPHQRLAEARMICGQAPEAAGAFPLLPMRLGARLAPPVAKLQKNRYLMHVCRRHS